MPNPILTRAIDALASRTDLSEDQTAEVLAEIMHGDVSETQIAGSIWLLTMMEKQIRGSLYGSSNAQHDIPRMLEMYNNGQLKLDELITSRYSLDDINAGYQDLDDGKIIRGVITHQD